MNKRQAKIEALWMVAGVLQGIDAIRLDLPPGDQEKVEAELLAIVQQFITRAIRLEE